MKKILVLATAAFMLMSTSCTTSRQMAGTVAGASLGGMFGSSIGGILGGWRGHDAGRLIGMVVGGAAGAAVTAPKTQSGEYSSSDGYYNNRCDDSYYQNDYNSPYANLDIDNIRLIEGIEDHGISANEHSTLVFEIRNVGNEYVYNIAPVITVTGTKHIYLSPTAIISELGPGHAVRYKAEVVADKKLKNGVADFNISFADGNNKYMMRSFQIRTYSRR
ncbi:MAG: glycine zipper family protein [Bacteroidales bacterium]|nr:glycine zipper family protein [Candidatus Sodaliphilus aphodohippi]